MFPSVEKGGDPTVEISMMMVMLLVMDERMIRLQLILAYPLENIPSSREVFPLFIKSSFCKETPQIAFLSEHVAILGYLCLASTSRTHPCFVDY